MPRPKQSTRRTKHPKTEDGPHIMAAEGADQLKRVATVHRRPQSDACDSCDEESVDSLAETTEARQKRLAEEPESAGAGPGANRANASRADAGGVWPSLLQFAGWCSASPLPGSVARCTANTSYSRRRRRSRRETSSGRGSAVLTPVPFLAQQGTRRRLFDQPRAARGRDDRGGRQAALQGGDAVLHLGLKAVGP